MRELVAREARGVGEGGGRRWRGRLGVRRGEEGDARGGGGGVMMRFFSACFGKPGRRCSIGPMGWGERWGLRGYLGRIWLMNEVCVSVLWI